MGSEELFITWNNHHRNVVGAFGRYLVEESLVDCTIAAEGQCLKAHRLVLSASSSYFELLFSQEMYTEKLVILEDVKFKDLKSLIAFMYEGQVTITKDSLRDYIKAAEFLRIKGLPGDLLLNALREATDMSTEGRKEAVASQLTSELMRCSPVVSESSSLQCISSISRKQSVDENFSTCMQTDSSQESVYLQPQYSCKSDTKRENANFPGEKQRTVEPKEEVEVEDNPIWDSEDENTSAVADITSATASGNVESELTAVQDTVSGRSRFVSSPHILEEETETPVCKLSSGTATIPSSSNTACSSPLVPNIKIEQSSCAMDHSSSCKQTQWSERIIRVKKEPLVGTEVIPAVISLERESIVEPMHSEWVEELQYCEGQDLIAEMDSADTCYEKSTIQDLDATVAPDNCQSAVWPNDILKALASGCVEAQRVRKEVHSLEVKETEEDEECFAGECTEIDVNHSIVDKMAESEPSVVEIDDDYAVKDKHVMDGKEIVKSALEAGVTGEKSEVEEVDSIPLSECTSKILKRQSCRCLRCAGVFGSVSELRLHVRNMHQKKSSKSCEVCEATFTYRSQLMRHMRKHTNERPFKCDICQRAFSHKCILIRHIRTHLAEGPFQCDECGRSFSSRGMLTSHKQTHSSERPFKCDVCSVSFIRDAHLKRHKQIHSGERPFKCDVCSMSFSLNSSLYRHKLIHTGERPFKCDVCSVSFSQNVYLNRHKQIHSGERPFKCDVCSVSFLRNAHLNRHKLIHSGERPFKCDVCSVSFIQNSNLKIHKRIHSGERPFKCDVCSLSFIQKSNLKAHKRIHSGERPLKCDVCSVSFSRSDQLNRHKLIHLGERPFKCEVCSVSYIQKSHL